MPVIADGSRCEVPLQGLGLGLEAVRGQDRRAHCDATQSAAEESRASFRVLDERTGCISLPNQGHDIGSHTAILPWIAASWTRLEAETGMGQWAILHKFMWYIRNNVSGLHYLAPGVHASHRGAHVQQPQVHAGTRPDIRGIFGSPADSAVDRSAAVGRALVQIAMSAISIRRRLSRRASEADAVIDSQAWGIGAIRDFSEHR